MWGGAESKPSLSEGVLASKVIYLALVEKVRVLRGGVSFTCVVTPQNFKFWNVTKIH
jgi:hypothetical protein